MFLLPRLLDRAPRRRPMIIVEDPEDLGYRFMTDPLLELLSPDEWRALESQALEPRP